MQLNHANLPVAGGCADVRMKCSDCRWADEVRE